MTTMAIKMKNAFEAAGITVDEFVAAAAEEKEALRLRREHKATATAVKKAINAAKERRAARRAKAAEKEAHRTARRAARKLAKAWGDYKEFLNEELKATEAAESGWEELFLKVPGTDILATEARILPLDEKVHIDYVWYNGDVVEINKDFSPQHYYAQEAVAFKVYKNEVVVILRSKYYEAVKKLFEENVLVEVKNKCYRVDDPAAAQWVIDNCTKLKVGYNRVEGKLKKGVLKPEMQGHFSFNKSDVLNAFENEALQGEVYTEEYTVVDSDELKEDCTVDSVVSYCPECGKYSESYWGEYGECNCYKTVVTDGNYLYGVVEQLCPRHAAVEKLDEMRQLTFTKIVESLEKRINKTCPVCGTVTEEDCYNDLSLLQYLTATHTLEGTQHVYSVKGDELCLPCKTVACGAGLNGVKDDITVNHGLWAYNKDQRSLQGAKHRWEEFYGMPAEAEFCASESTQYVGGFGVQIKHPYVKAAFGYDHGDAYTERDGFRRYATRNFDRGVKDKASYDREVRNNLAHGNGGNNYIELIVKNDENSAIDKVWMTEEFFVGHPHYTLLLQELADEKGLPFVVVSESGEEIDVETAIKKIITDGQNQVVSHDTIDGETWGHFDYDRSALRWYLFSLLTKRAEQNAKCEKKAVVVVGLPGSGKTTYLKSMPEFASVDPDVIKWLLPEYNGGNAEQVHTESVKLSTWANQWLAHKGVNLAFATTKPWTVEAVKEMLTEEGYDVDIKFIDTDPKICFERIQGRKRSMNVSLEQLTKLREEILAVINNEPVCVDEGEDFDGDMF